MSIEVRPAANFENVRTVMGPRRPDANVYWCLTYRITPKDIQGEKVHLTTAYVGTQALLEQAGFRKTSDTISVINGFPRLLMRLELEVMASPPP